MIRKLLAALLVGAAVVALDRPDEAAEAARRTVDEALDEALDEAVDKAVDKATGRAGEALAARCRADPAACLRRR